MLNEITSSRKFREQFDIQEILANPCHFIHLASQLDFSRGEEDCIRLFGAVACWGCEAAVIRCGESDFIYTCGDLSCAAVYTSGVARDLAAGDLPAEPRSRLIGIAVLCEAARHGLASVGEASAMVGPVSENTVAGSPGPGEFVPDPTGSGFGNEIRVSHTSEPWRFQLWTPECGVQDPIRTVRIVDGDRSSLGEARISVEVSGGRVLRSVRLQRGQYLYANFRGDRLVELLPPMSASGSHCTYRRPDESGCRLCRRRFYNTEEFCYAPELCNVTQFAADDNGGFVAIRDREVVLFSNIFHRSQFAFAYDDGEYPVEVAVRGEEFVVLSNRGRTRSNCGFDREGILSVGFSASHVAYALTETGELVSNRDSGCDPLGVPVAEVCTFDRGMLLLRGRDAAFHATIALEELGIPQACEGVSRARVYDGVGYWLSDTGRLYRQTEVVADGILDFDIVHGRLIALDERGMKIVK